MIRIFCAVLCLTATSSAWAQGYVNLLSNHTLDQWMKPGGQVVDKGWEIQPDGTLHRNGRAGHILSRQQYGDFELWFEFKIAEKGNSGIKYRVKKYGKSWLGLEYQVLDDKAFPKLTREHHTASLYDLVTPIPLQTRFRPEGEFNVGKVRVQNQRIQHWINGQIMIDQPVGTGSWDHHVTNSKFRKHDGFGENTIGHIMLTDHGSEVWYRNVFIKSLCNPCCN